MNRHITKPLRLVIAVNPSTPSVIEDLEDYSGEHVISRVIQDLEDRADPFFNVRLTIYHTGVQSDGETASTRYAYLASRRSTYEEAMLSPWVITPDHGVSSPFHLEVPLTNELQLFLERDPENAEDEHSLVLYCSATRHLQR
jgi:hypothetical protein